MALKQYIQETRAEMNHVTWATRKQALMYSLLVVGISVFVAIYLGLLDSVFGAGLKMIIPSLN